MNSSEISDNVIRITSELFSQDIRGVTKDSVIREFEKYDSLEQINYFLVLEEEFGIKFDMDELTEIKTVGDIIQRVVVQLCG